MMSFGDAFNAVKEGKVVTLEEWGGDIVMKAMSTSDAGQMPYLYLEGSFGKVPYTPSQTEIFSESWKVVA